MYIFGNGGKPMIAKLIPVGIFGIIGWACLVSLGEDQPDPHAADLARQVIASFPSGRTKITVTTATKKDITFNVLYSTDYMVDGQREGKDLIQAMIRKLLADGQQPHDKKIHIHVWGNTIAPGTVGESGHKTEPYEHPFYWSRYEPDLDYIDFENCGMQPWRFGHCS
jgi:hypothetical protein